VEGQVFQEADLQTNGYDLAEVGGGDVFAAGAEVSEAEVAGAGELKARGDDGGVEIEGGAKLDLEAELHSAGGEGFAAEHPAATVGQGRGEGGEEAVALFVAEALDIERLHCVICSSRLGVSAVRLFIGGDGKGVTEG
jgi:hypothetical protein